jgi:hypothetical protein
MEMGFLKTGCAKSHDTLMSPWTPNLDENHDMAMPCQSIFIPNRSIDVDLGELNTYIAKKAFRLS